MYVSSSASKWCTDVTLHFPLLFNETIKNGSEKKYNNDDTNENNRITTGERENRLTWEKENKLIPIKNTNQLKRNTNQLKRNINQLWENNKISKYNITEVKEYKTQNKPH